MATTYDVYVGIPKEADFDWEASSAGLEHLDLVVQLGSELGRLRGRQLDWGAWIAPVSKAEILGFAGKHGWGTPAKLDALHSAGSYYLVGFEG
jgi:hypothetical protein